MEIIKKGVLPSDKKIQSTCRNCHTVFAFRKGEARECSDRDGPLVAIDCPLCHKECFVNPFKRDHVVNETEYNQVTRNRL